MPLDTDEVAGSGELFPAHDRLAPLRPVKIVLGSEAHVGAALKAAREQLGLSEEDIAQVTRVKTSYIAAIEDFDFLRLPARPFVVGYVRAYALALGLDPEAVDDRFRQEAPRVDGRLREPGGLRREALGGARWLLLIGAVVAGAVVVWNLTRRVELAPRASADSAPRAAGVPRPAPGPALIGAPLPTPPEATTPPVYQTPGLAIGPPPGGDATAGQGGAGAAPASAAPFVAAGVVYGAPSGPGVVLQARKATTVVMRGGGGAILFARLLAAGEAWRAPVEASGLVADVGDPGDVEVFVGGLSRGRLTQAQTALSGFAGP